jgi:hypothetical protein
MVFSGESKVRLWLKERDPALHQLLVRNWAMAWEEWLPALGLQKDSFNSYPHLRNLEEHLDQFLVDDADGQGRLRFDLQPIEAYLILAAILFHDIGRIIKPAKHADESRRLLRDHHAALGIPSRELANALGDICWYHDPAGTSREKVEKDLAVVTVEPYGQIRKLELGVLLVLVDHLDGAFRRVLPAYLQGAGGYQPIGHFRSLIRGIRADHKARMVCVALANFENDRVQGTAKGKRQTWIGPDHLIFSLSDRARDEHPEKFGDIKSWVVGLRKVKSTNPKLLEEKEFEWEDLPKGLVSKLSSVGDKTLLWEQITHARPGGMEWLIANNLLLAKKVKPLPPKGGRISCE